MESSSSYYKLHFFLFLWLGTLTIFGHAWPRVGYYKNTCPNVESIVFRAVKSGVSSNPRAAPGILRMHFHDCFVNGCDASILLDGPTSEKTAPPNVPIQGFDVIDAAKAQLEAVCPGVVSCADIIALAARDSVVLTGGRSWEVQTGRRDGLVSRASDTVNLPAFNDSISTQIQKFSDKGLNIQDLVVLVGGHTIGQAACVTFSYRLYNFNNTNGPDPDINPSFLPQLRALCPNGGNASTRVFMDTGSGNRFDTSYFVNLKNGRGVLESDAKLFSDSRTRGYVQQILGKVDKSYEMLRKQPKNKGSEFDYEFGISMVKMGNIELKTGSQGEIRRICTATN